MAKFVVVYFDGGELVNAGYADELPRDGGIASKGVFETGSLADGSPAYLLIPDWKYEPETDVDLSQIASRLATSHMVASSDSLSDSVLETVISNVREARGDWFESSDGVEWEGRLLPDNIIQMKFDNSIRLFKLSITELPGTQVTSSVNARIYWQEPDQGSWSVTIRGITKQELRVIQQWARTEAGSEWGLSIPSIRQVADDVPTQNDVDLNDFATAIRYNIGESVYKTDCPIFAAHGITRS